MARIASSIRSFVVTNPTFYALCAPAYRFIKGSNGTSRKAILRRKTLTALSRYPHIFRYVGHLNTIRRGHVRLGIRQLLFQIYRDCGSLYLSYGQKKKHKKLKEIYHQAIMSCIEQDVPQWWHFLPDEKYNSIHTLQVFLRDGVLRRAGDYKQYITLTDELRQLFPSASSPQGDCYYKLAEHYAAVMAEIESGAFAKTLPLDPNRRPMLLGFSVWGERYINMLLNYCLPSLMAEGNLKALCKERQPILFIHTNPESKQILEQADIVQRIKALGVVVHYCMLDESLIALFDVDSNFRYWHLGMVQSIDLYVAKAIDADFQLLFPDVIYSDQHFAGLLRVVANGQHAITRLGLSTCMEGICPALESYRQNGALVVPAADLAALSVTHTHSASWSWIATHKNVVNELPRTYMIMWEGKDTLHTLALHQTILYLDRAILRQLPPRFYITLDSELDKIIPADCPIYCPRPEDGLYLIEVTSEKQRPTELNRNTIEEFCRIFWDGAQGSMKHWRVFDQGIADPLNRAMIPQRTYMEEAEIDQMKQALKRIVLKQAPAISPEEAVKALSLIKTIETHPRAKSLKPHLTEAVQSFQAIIEASSLPGAAKSMSKMNRSVLEKLYREAILCCVQHGVHRWWDFLPHTSLPSIHTLQAFLRECVLRRAGDYKSFIRIRNELKALSHVRLSQDTFLDDLAIHYDNTIQEIESGAFAKTLPLDPNRRPMLLGFSVWGERYINMLLNYCLPSLMAEGNLKALCKERQPILFIHTNPESKQILEQADIVQRIKALGVIVAYQMINENLVRQFSDTPESVYWHLGMVQSFDLYCAKALNADYHLLMPDSVYSDHHFANLLQSVARGHPVIIRLMLSTCMEGICPAIDRYRGDGAITIPAADLTALSVAHVHSASRSWIITHNDLTTELPNVHVAILEGKDTLHMLSPHQTILYIDREAIRTLPKRFYLTLDSELDKIIPDGYSIYCPQATDEICLIEMTSEKQRPMELTKQRLEQFCKAFWYSAQQSMEYWKIFDKSVIDRLNREMLPDRPYMEEAEISRAKNTIKTALLAHYPAITDKQIDRAVKILRAIRRSPEGQAVRHLIDKAIAELQTVPEEERTLLAA